MFGVPNPVPIIGGGDDSKKEESQLNRRKIEQDDDEVYNIVKMFVQRIK